MPKIIENLQNNILDEARRIVDENGADALSMRNLANRLGIAPSTLYNYYESKEQLTGALLKKSWAEALAEIDGICGRQTEDRSVQELAEVVAVLRRTIRPLLQQHISQVTKKKEKPRFDVNAVVMQPLQERVQRILENNGRSEADAKAMAPVLMKLLVTCMFDMELEFEEILEAAGKLQSVSRQQK
ncbi:MAG: TetR/AcrR family transcriptional regulator [Lentihominibacter sp.]